MEAFRADPMKLASWVADSIQVDNNCNLVVHRSHLPEYGVLVWQMRIAVIYSLYPWREAWGFRHVLTR